jgi:hypothetical protein
MGAVTGDARDGMRARMGLATRSRCAGHPRADGSGDAVVVRAGHPHADKAKAMSVRVRMPVRWRQLADVRYSSRDVTGIG